jgi:hypothetical protein
VKPTRRFQALPTGYKEISGRMRVGVVKESHVRRILQIGTEIPSNEVPKFGYLRVNTNDARGFHPEGSFVTKNASGDCGLYIMKYFNEMGCTRVITDSRGALGGLDSFLSMYATYGTDRESDSMPSNSTTLNKPIRGSQSGKEGALYKKLTGKDSPIVDKFMGYKPSKTAELMPEALFDRCPVRYPGIDTNINPNPIGTKKRHMYLHCGESISMTQWNFFEHKQLDGKGNAYYRPATEDDSSEDVKLGLVSLDLGEQTVETMTYGTCSRPFCTAGNYPTTQDDNIAQFNPNPEESEVLPMQPLLQLWRFEAPTLMKRSDGTSIGQWGDHYKPDWTHDYDAQSFFQDIGFTKDLIGNLEFEGFGGVERYGKPVFEKQVPVSEEKSYYIPSSEVDFFDQLTHRDRVLERTIWMMSQEDWREHRNDQEWAPSNF